jgi:hypothetical protein
VPRAAPFVFAALAVPVLLGATAASADHLPGPCERHREEGETVRSQMKRIIRCAVDRWEVPGGSERAICIADRESDLDPKAESANGEYLGLFQHSAEAWPDRYEGWTHPSWQLPESALHGRTNAVVTIRMVNAEGWGPWEGLGCDEETLRARALR